MNADMIDISSAQANTLGYSELKKQGINKAAIKLTEGTWYSNEYRYPQVTGAKAAGMVVMPYHYFRANSVTQAQAEANYFMSAIKAVGLSTVVPIALDVEDPSLNTTSVLVSYIDAFFNQCWNAGYHNLFIYGSLSWFQQGLLTPSNFTHRPKSWVAAYPVVAANDSMRPINCDVWQFTSMGGSWFTSGYTGNGGLDLNKDYTNSVVNLGSVSTEEDETVAYSEIPSSCYGILVFSKDTKINNRTFKKGSGWQIVNDYRKQGVYNLGGGIVVDPHVASQAWVYVQPSPYTPSDPKTAVGLAVTVKYNKGYGVALHQQPKASAPFTVRPAGAYMPNDNDPKDNIYYVFREQGAWRVDAVDMSTSDVWIELGTKCWAKLSDFNVSIGK